MAGKESREFREIYDRLLDFYGPRGWWPVTPEGGVRPEYRGGPANHSQRLEVALGALLIQNTSWSSGARKAIENLTALKLMNFQALLEIPEPELAPLIRSSGYFNQKARKIKTLILFLSERYGIFWERFFTEPAGRMRELLLELNGIGPETADSIVLYAAGYPSFVIDNYTKRLFYRLGHSPLGIPYESLKRRFETALPAESGLYGEYHALIVTHCKERCTSRGPACKGCPLSGLCARRGVDPEEN